MVNSSRRRGTVVVAAAIDLGMVLLFVAVGRGFHAEPVGLLGMYETAWPFIAGLALGWAVTRAWRDPWRVVRPGIGIWIVTVAAGMMLRFVAGLGTALSFIIVATVALAVLLLGWRAIARPLRAKLSS